MPVQNRRRAYLITVVLYGGPKTIAKNINKRSQFSIILLKVAKIRQFIQVCVPENRTQNRKSGGAPIAVLKSAFWDSPI